MGIAELHQAGPLERSALFRESFYSAQSNSLLAVKKNWEASKAYVSQISKKWKTRFQEESVRTEVQGELPVWSQVMLPGLGDTGGDSGVPGEHRLLQPPIAEPQQTHCSLNRAGRPCQAIWDPLTPPLCTPRAAFEQDIAGGSTSHLGECEGECGAGIGLEDAAVAAAGPLTCPNQGW